jgi:hypothetical protein
MSADRSLFVCFKEVTDPQKQQSAYYNIVDFLYPGGQSYALPLPGQQKAANAPSNACTMNFDGHVTDHDAALKHRLPEIVRRLDRDVFDSDLSTINDLIACNGTIQ